MSCSVIMKQGSDISARCSALAQELRSRGRQVLSESAPTDKVLGKAIGLQPAVVVLDGRLSANDLRAVARSIEHHPAIGVLVLAPLLPHLEVLLTLSSGVTGYLAPEVSAAMAADTVDALCAGGVVVPRDAFRLIADRRLTGRRITVERADGRPVELTHREWEVFLLVRQAYSTAEIADRLVVATVTVRTHVAALVRKLGARDRAALTEPLDEGWWGVS
jgi:DNA-binding NarL/FixJ family response regulator